MLTFAQAVHVIPTNRGSGFLASFEDNNVVLRMENCLLGFEVSDSAYKGSFRYKS